MYSNILVAIALDHAQGNSEAIDLARRLLKEGGKITALNVVEDVPSYVANQIPADLLSNRRTEAETELKSELGGVSDIACEVVTGHAGRTIVDYAAAKAHDCIIISSHRPGLQDYFLGSTAQRVVRHAKCAVHVLR